jgi:SAM-dependent methyltransferase
MTPRPELHPSILDYYNQDREDSRLREGSGRLEFWRTQDILGRVLPQPPGRLLDVGGGTGIHAVWLAEAGWEVDLVDPVPHHVELAGRLPGVTARLGDARRLEEASESYDVVLMLGPLYHLLDAGDRAAAFAEATRVVRPGGVVVAATINRFAPLHDHLSRGTWFEPERRPRLIGMVSNGYHTPGGGDFTTAYFHQPAEAREEAAAAGLEVREQYGIEGAAWMVAGAMARLDDEGDRAAVLEAVRLTESDPALLGVSGHLLTVARRPE